MDAFDRDSSGIHTFLLPYELRVIDQAEPPTGSEHAEREYQSLSPLAALAFVLGLLSLAVLVTPLLLIIPAAAIGVAALAFSKIRASDGALTGTRLAQWGLALALGCAVAAFVRDPVRNALMRRQADAVARQWLSLVAEGKFDDSLKYLAAQTVQSLGPKTREDGSGPTPTAEEVRAAAIERLRTEPLTLRLATLKPPLRIVAADPSGDAPIFDGARTILGSRLVVTGSDPGDQASIDFALVRTRYYEAEGRPWRIERWVLLDNPPTVSAAIPAPDAG